MKNLRICALLLCCALGLGTAQARYDQVEFFHLIERNDASSTRKALAEGEFSANTFNHEGFSALYLALREPAPAVADLLIEDPRTKLNLENAWGENALMMAALRGLLPQAIRMMELGAEVNKKGWAPLHYAASSGNLPMIKLLLDNYAYIDAQSPTGETPLMMAAARGTPAAVQMLLDAEADPNLKNKKRQTAIAMALERGNTDNAKIIRDWLLRGGKAAATPSPAPRAEATAKNNSNQLPIGSGSAAVNNYGGAVSTPEPVPSATPSPAPTLTPEATPSPTPEAHNQTAEDVGVEVQAVPEPGQAEAEAQVASPIPEASARAEAIAPIQTATPVETAAPAEPPISAATLPSTTTPSTATAPTPRPAAQAAPRAAPSVADILAQPASQSLLQILSQPAPAANTTTAP